MNGENPGRIEAALAEIGRRARLEAPPAGVLEAARLRLKSRRDGPSLLWPVILTGALLLAAAPFFVASPYAAFTTVKLALVVLSLAAASVCLLYPERLARADHFLLRGIHVQRGLGPVALSEIPLFRLQGVYFAAIAFFICRI